MKIYFLTPYPYDEVASQRFRFEQYYGELQKENIEYKTGSFHTVWSYRVLYRKGFLPVKIAGLVTGFIKRLWHSYKCLSFDLIFIHRELSPIGPPFYEWLITKVLRKKVIYDFDDAIWMTEKNKSSIWDKLRWRKKVSTICRWAFKVSCGNAYLADFARQFNTNVIINPTTIDIKMAGRSKHGPETESLTIGWTGTHSTLPYLRSVHEPVEKILNDFAESRFLIICNKKPEFSFKRMDFIKWEKSSEWTDLNKIDIGIMPLPEDEWSRGKCGFKILQYFSVGIPAVASPVGVNADIIQPGVNGFLCNNNDEWYSVLSDLIRNRDLRKKIGARGKKSLIDNYSLTSNRTNFFRLFEK